MKEHLYFQDCRVVVNRERPRRIPLHGDRKETLVIVKTYNVVGPLKASVGFLEVILCKCDRWTVFKLESVLSCGRWRTV